MKIAIIVCTFPPYRGGIGNVAYNEARELANLGNEVTVFTPRYDATQDKIQKVNGITIRRLLPVIKSGNAAFLPELLWLLKNFEIIYLHYPFFGGAEMVYFLKKFNGKKKLFIRYHMDVVNKGFKSFLFKCHTRYFMPRIIKSAVSSLDYANNSDIKDLAKEGSMQFIEIPFGVDLEKFYYKEKDDLFLDELNLNKNEKIALFVGNLDRAHYFKGVEYLIEAFSLIEERPYKLMIVGSGELKQNYENTARRLGIFEKVIFVGSPSDKDLPSYYNIADAVILPSIDKSEAFGLVLIEAMACKKPVIASNLAGVRSVVEDGVNGFLVKPKNTGELANRLDYILNNSEVAKDLGEKGRQKVEEYYNWKEVGRRLLNEFTQT